ASGTERITMGPVVRIMETTLAGRGGGPKGGAEIVDNRPPTPLPQADYRLFPESIDIRDLPAVVAVDGGHREHRRRRGALVLVRPGAALVGEDQQVGAVALQHADAAVGDRGGEHELLRRRLLA